MMMMTIGLNPGPRARTVIALRGMTILIGSPGQHASGRLTGDAKIEAKEHILELNNIFRDCMSRAFGRRGARRTGVNSRRAPWWGPACDEARSRFRAAHKADISGGLRRGAIQLSLATVNLRREYKRVTGEAKMRYEIQQARAMSDLLLKNPRAFYRIFNNKSYARLMMLINGPTGSKP